MEESNYVSEKVCKEKHRTERERYEFNQGRLNKMEENTEELTKLGIQMGEILKRHDATIANHDNRITTLEKKPGKLVDKIQSVAITAIVSGLISALMALILK